MSLEHAYASLDVLKARLGLQSSDGRDDEALEGLIEAVSRAIDEECFGGESQFYAIGTTPSFETRYFTATCEGELLVDDLLALSTLKTDPGSGTFDTIWAPTDYVLAPYNAQTGSVPRPYWRLERAHLGTNAFPAGARRGVQVVGTWGFCTDANRPKQVETVCLREALYAFTANRSPGGMTTGDGSVEVAPSVSLSNYSKAMLAAFRRVTVA